MYDWPQSIGRKEDTKPSKKNIKLVLPQHHLTIILNNNNKDGTKAFKSSNPPNIPILRRGVKCQINFPFSPAHPATPAPALTLAPTSSHDQALDLALTNSSRNNTYEHHGKKEGRCTIS